MGYSTLTLNVCSEFHPMTIHMIFISNSAVEVPPVLVYQVAKRHEYELGQCHVEEDVDVGFLFSTVNIFA